MNVEIERKFLVRNGGWEAEPQRVYTIIEQGYLIQDSNHILRIRTAGHEGWLTIKSAEPGMTRAEYEYEIPYKHAQELLDRCPDRLTKARHTIIVGTREWSVDVFKKDNYGLVVVETEFESEDQKFELPNWVGEEVTDDPKYYNADLAKHPYNTW